MSLFYQRPLAWERCQVLREAFLLDFIQSRCKYSVPLHHQRIVAGVWLIWETRGSNLGAGLFFFSLDQEMQRVGCTFVHLVLRRVQAN